MIFKEMTPKETTIKKVVFKDKDFNDWANLQTISQDASLYSLRNSVKH